MFNILSRYRKQNKGADSVYALCLSAARNPVFYDRYHVPDTFDGRFEMVVLHVFCVMQATPPTQDNTGENTDFHQTVFDALFKDMDQTLREMGIGDTGVPKHMRKMMTGFNGRVHAYRDDMRDAIGRNVYGTANNPDAHDIDRLYTHMQNTITYLQSESPDAIKMGQFTFPDPQP